MRYWLLKTEPGEWRWEHQERNGGLLHWDGVRSGDHAFFYHFGRLGLAFVGVVEVARAAYPDASDVSSKHCVVNVRALAPLPRPCPLSLIRADAAMRDWILLRQSRLSVMPVSPSVCELGGISPPPCVNADEDAAAVPEVKPKKEQMKMRVKDLSSEDEPKKRARRLPGKAMDVEGDVKE